MIKIYDNGFTETLWRYIKKISLKALNTITPSNFLYLTNDKLSDIIQSNLFFVDDSVVNSVQMAAVNSAIGYLKPNNIEILTLSQTITDADFQTNVGNEEYFIVTFDIPEGFDGRKCFPYIQVDGYDQFTCGDLTLNYLNITSRNNGIAGHRVLLNADRVEIKFWIGVTSLTTIPDHVIVLELWRNK